MIALSIGATAVAHGIHYAVLGVGLIGLVALLGPQLVGHRAEPGHDEHSLRVRALAVQLAAGSPGAPVTPTLPSRLAPPAPLGSTDPARSRYLPLAVVSSVAAAGVHAAVGPAHFREAFLLGMFFAGAALAQIGWSLLMAVRPARALLVAAVVGNAAVLALWLTTRTVGLPGVLPREAVGPWDVCCAAWELVIVISASRVLRTEHHVALRPPAWADWEPLARFWALGSVTVLAALTLSGAGA